MPSFFIVSFKISRYNTTNAYELFSLGHGGWGGWSNWPACPVTCGGAKQIRTRACDNPSPAYDGKNCTGSASETQGCNEFPCPGEFISKCYKK